jgi:hypothetical protein
MQPDDMNQKNASGLNREIQEGVPDRFADLLKQLDKTPTEGKSE